MVETRKSWRKNLYENLGYEDNYTDQSFLKDLQKNKNVKIFTLTEAVRGATLLNNQISCITGFLLIFYFMYHQHISPSYILLASAVPSLGGYILFTRKDFNLDTLLEHSKTLLTVLVFGFIFSPVFHTLTDAISTDTIFFMTFFVMFMHLVFFDYGIPAAVVSKAISLNAAIFGSICLASRLASSYHVFVLLIVSAEFFVLYPIFTSAFWSPFLLIPISCICSYFLYLISIPVLVTYLIVTISINFLFPFIFVKAQRYKNNINGPWDEAIVKDSNCEINK